MNLSASHQVQEQEPSSHAGVGLVGFARLKKMGSEGGLVATL